MSFPRDSAFSEDKNNVRELFRSTENQIHAQEDKQIQSATVSYHELEDWYHRLDELVRRFDVPREHVVSGNHVATASEDLERLRDEIYRHLR